jgi:hypothetical protein
MQIPNTITRANKIGPTYKLKFNGRNIYLKDRNSFINVCIISKNGESLWHSYNPIMNDTYNDETVTFTGPILKDISTILVSPESCEFEIEYISLETQDQNNIFIKKYGFSKNTVCFVLPSINILEIDHDKREESMLEYETLKKNILITTGQLVFVGSSLLTTTGSFEIPTSFAFGGLLSLIHHKLLQNDIDGIGRFNLNNILLRSATVFIGLGGIIQFNHNKYISIETAEFLSLFAGLLTSRFAIYIVVLQMYLDERNNKKPKN